jgi:hypothetical protein
MKQAVGVDLFYDGVWNEQPDSVYARDPIVITRGNPSTATLTFDNHTIPGKYAPKSIVGPLYGKIGQNTPLRIRCDVEPLHRDTFTRTASNNWGTIFATTAGGWTIVFSSGSNADFNVNGSQGTHAVTTAASYRMCFLAEIATDDPDVTATVTMPVPTGGNLEPCIILCGLTTTTYYMLRANVKTTNAIDLVIIAVVNGFETTLATVATSLTHSATTPLTLRGRLSAGQIEFGAAQGSEPTSFQAVAYDSSILGRGWVGVRSGRAAANTNTGTQFAWDNVAIRIGRTRFVGEVDTWTPDRAVKGDAWTKVKACGVRQRLGIGVDPLKSSARQYYEGLAPLGYAPMEPGSRLTNVVDDARPMQFSGTEIDWGVYSGPQGSDKGPKFFLNDDRPPVSQMFLPLDGTSVEWQVNLWFRAHAGPNSDIFFASVVDFIEIATSGTVAYWTVEAFSDPSVPQLEITATGFDSNRDIISPTVSAVISDYEAIDDRWHMITIQASESGGFASVAVSIDANAGASDFTASYTNGRLLGVYLPKRSDPSNVSDPSMMHLVAFDDQNADVADLFFAGLGWPGESADVRFLRLCRENNVLAYVAGTTTGAALMGPQGLHTLLEHLDEIERTDDAIIYEPRAVLGLGMRTGQSKLNQKSKLTLAYGAGGGEIAPPLTPVVGAANIRNDVTASNPAGGERRVEQTTGTYNTQLPGTAAGAVGRYATRMNVNFGVAEDDPVDDDSLIYAAGWRVGKGTWDGTWYAGATADLDAAPYLAPAVAAIDYGDLITLDALPLDDALQALDHLVVGYTETLGTHRRTIRFDLEPGGPYQVGVLSGTSGDTDPFVGHLETDGSTTSGAILAGAASFSVATPSGPLWSTDADDYPENFLVGGQEIGVSAVSGASSPQTFTVQTTGRQFVYPVPSGSPVAVADPIVPTL